ncbi:MAG TPA: RIP metalloprotease RseP [Gemmatimonadales bacterium]
MLITILSLLVVLGVLIFAHEAGHFLAAKWAGIYVHRFSLGLGSPVRWLTFRRGETEYSISWLPLGGYVKMASREEEATSAALEGGREQVEVPPDRVFEAKPVWKRMIVILAGVTMNFLFAYLIYTSLALAGGRELLPETRVGAVVDSLVPAGAEALRALAPGDRIVAVNGAPVATWNAVIEGVQNAPGATVRLGLEDGRELVLDVHSDAMRERLAISQAVLPWRPAVVDTVLAGRAAERGGLLAGDTLVALDGVAIAQWTEFQDFVSARPREAITVTVGRPAGRVDLRMTTDTASRPGPDGTPQVIGFLGIGPRLETVTEEYSFGGALAAGWRETVQASTQIGRTVRGLLSGRVAGRELGGPILIGQLAGQSARLGLEPFLALMALISVNLAVLNLLPIPVLDGGQLVFLIAEGVLRRPLSLKLRERLTAVGLVLILLLMVFAFSNDIRRVVEGWGGG